MHFWPINLAVIGGVAIAVAVLAGALVVGSSVRASLRTLALERLGSIDQVVTSIGFVRDTFSDELMTAEGMAGNFGAAAPMVAVEGFVTHQASGRRASGIQVYGVDERFWTFHGADADARQLDRNAVFVSEGLASELGAVIEDSLLIRVEKPSAVPISSLHGRRDDAGQTLRLGVERVLSSAELGEFSFRPQQGLARSVFVSLARLQRDLDQDGHVNTILLSAQGEKEDDGTGDSVRLSTAEAAVRSVVRLADLGLRLRALPEHKTVAVESAAGLLNDEVTKAIESTAEMLDLRPEPIFTYLANGLRVDDRVTPYSLVTALDLRMLVDGVPEAGDGVSPVVLNRWVADDLEVSVGDSLTLDYFVWEDEGRLVTRETQLRVADIVPIAGAADDQELAPDYPGITEATDVTDWDPPFEIDLDLIRPKDEDYWDDYRTTPKAFIPLEVGQQLWGSRWGQLTSVRLFPDNIDANDSSERLFELEEQFRETFRSSLDPLASGFVVYPARSLALEASAGATDFGLYFIYFSFFLVVSALLLASLFFRLGVEQRLQELGLLRASGFPPRAIYQLFLSEAFVLSIVGSIVGVLGAIGYAEIIMWGLRTWWVDAVGTTRLAVDLSPVMLAVGALGGVLAALGSIAWTLRALAPASPRSLLTGAVVEVTGIPDRSESKPPSELRAWRIGFGLVGVGVVLVGFSATNLIGATGGFFGGGLTLLTAMLVLTWAWLNGRPSRHTDGPWSLSQMGFRNASYRSGRSVLCIALIASAAFIIVAVDAFRREGISENNDRNSGTGGYALLADTLLPIVHDPSTGEGQDDLFIRELFEDGEPLDGVTFGRFRLRPGEDASCLNLYQAKDPRVLAPTEEFVSEGRFGFGASMAETSAEEANPWLLLDRNFSDGAIPAIADSTSLAYALHLSVGDDFVLNRDTARPITLRIVAALSDSIFQRELLISEERFDQVFPDYEGYRFFLIDAQADRAADVSAALEDRLVDFGFDVVSAGERLAAFHRVENTYLATFQMLGGLGLVLGTFGLGAVLLRNVLERRRELALMRAVGYNAGHLSLMVLAENAFLLFGGLVTGTGSALIAIAPAWLERGGGVPFLSLASLLLLVVVTGLTASLGATVAAVRSPLLAALRSE